MTQHETADGEATASSPPGTGTVRDERMLADLETIPGQPRYW